MCRILPKQIFVFPLTYILIYWSTHQSFGWASALPTAVNNKSYSGALGESTCLSCNGNPRNDSLTISNLPDAYGKEQNYRILRLNYRKVDASAGIS